jgi:bacteriocin biosynthesis cyclodehydratase domain-containing protein
VVLKLDPRLPLVWRSPDSLQLGIDSPRATLEQVSNAQERMIAALVAGISRSGLTMVAKAAGASDSDASALLTALDAALQRPPAPGGTITLVGDGPTADRIATTLVASGATVGSSEHPDLAVIIAHYVIDPEQHGLWLRRDVPHLPVVFGDGEVSIGPIIEPGSGPCLHCLERERTDADPAWPAIASQLWGRRSPAESALVSLEVAGLVARLALTRLDGSRSEAATSLHLDVAGGQLRLRPRLPHPECACLALPGNDSVDVHPDRSGLPPRTAAAAAAPA